MFQDQRDYRAIAFILPGMESAPDVFSLIAKDSAKETEVLPISANEFEIAHSYYYSEAKFSPSEDLETMKVKRRGLSLYQYHMYAFRFKWRRTLVFFASVPFFRMAWEVFPKIREATRGQRLFYQKANVTKLFDVLLGEEPIPNRPSIGLTSFQVLGDPPLQSIALNGNDILHSKTYLHLRFSSGQEEGASSANGKSRHVVSEKASPLGGVNLSPKSCNIVYDDHEGRRFKLNVDSLGNYRFRIGKGAKNLPSARYLLTFLYKHELIDMTPVFPLRKGMVDEEEGEVVDV